MQEHITPNQHNPTQKFHKNLKNPKKFSKTQNLGLKMHECMKKRLLRTLTKRLRLEQGRIFSGSEDQSERRVFGSREKEIYRERSEKMRSETRLNLKQKMQLNGSRFYRALNLNRSGSIEDLLTTKGRPRWIKDLLSIY